MQYTFDYGFSKNNQWLDGVYEHEEYDDGKLAFARYKEIQTKGKEAEVKMREEGMLPEGNEFKCYLDVHWDDEHDLEVSFQFFLDAFNDLKEEYKQSIQDEENQFLQKE